MSFKALFGRVTGARRAVAALALLGSLGASRSAQAGPLVHQASFPGSYSYELYGSAVSISGTTALVGDEVLGSADVYELTAGGWSLQAPLVGAMIVDSPAATFFRSNAISGDTAVLGASHLNQPGGELHIFHRAGGAWSEEQVIKATDPNVYNLGDSVALSGDTLVAGTAANGIFVYVRSAGTWTLQQTLFPAQGAAGGSVAISGDTVVVGSQTDYHNGTNDAGTVHIYVRSGSTWTEQQQIIAPVGPPAQMAFGRSVGISGDTIVVGAYLAKRAYVYTRSGAAWTEQQMLEDGALNNTYFGEDVAIENDTILVGTDNSDAPGAAYLFSRSGGVWSLDQKLPSPAAGIDRFGHSVALSGGTVVIGANTGNSGGKFIVGAVHMFGAPLGGGSTSSSSSGVGGSGGSPATTSGVSATGAGGASASSSAAGSSSGGGNTGAGGASSAGAGGSASPPDPDQGSGCGCRTAPASSPLPDLAAAMIACLVLALRRRSPSTRTPSARRTH